MKFKHLLTLSFCIFLISIASAQKPEKVKIKTEKGINGITNIKYQVLKSNKKTKHGYYKIINTHYKQLEVSGTYKFGKKEGLWQEWMFSPRSLKSEGYYKNGKKVGVWEYYDEVRRSLLHTYNHDTNTLNYSSSCGKNYPRDVIINSERVKREMDCVPDLVGGVTTLMNDINLTYFLTQKKNEPSESFVANISILIKKDGTIGEIDANGSYLNKRFIAIIKEKTNNPELIWLPGTLNGEKVDSYTSFGIYSSSYD
ncbi:hypothetical protein [Bizionia arctica]|uniref:MORN repeat variant n=1 Tax=Bizionia arctica TaxID=1495645 RepID=A0A917GQ14_9FLAO|nr:hypothetical protein [Bizionia arctica]GGG53509.1 hypothetical protein GCM10010976_25620 [Bizionia arctica]